MLDVLQGETFGNWQGKLGKPCTIFFECISHLLINIDQKGDFMKMYLLIISHHLINNFYF